MEFTKINNSDILVSQIGLGTWAIGGMMWGGTDEKESIKTILKAIDYEINLIDTAPAYGDGVSERIIGKAIKEYGKREEVILATKCGLMFSDKGIIRNSSAGRIKFEIEQSLKNLETEYIDIYQVHWPDYNVPIEETAEVMLNLLKEGKIRAIGVSNYNVEQVERFRKIAPIHTIQPPYNLFEKEIEAELLPHCIDENITVLAYGAICRGLLTGKMKPETKFDKGDIRYSDPKFRKPRFNEYLKAVNMIDKFAREKYGKTVLELSIRWILDMNVTVALWGARHPEQLLPISNIWDFHIEEEDKKEIKLIISESIKNPIGPEFMAPGI